MTGTLEYSKFDYEYDGLPAANPVLFLLISTTHASYQGRIGYGNVTI